jgi:hypothetical protein
MVFISSKFSDIAIEKVEYYTNYHQSGMQTKQQTNSTPQIDETIDIWESVDDGLVRWYKTQSTVCSW